MKIGNPSNLLMLCLILLLGGCSGNGHEDNPGEDHGHEHESHSENHSLEEKENGKKHEEHNDHGNDSHENHDEHGDHEGHGASVSLGEGKAVEAYEEHEYKIKLGAKAIQRLKIQTRKPEAGSGVLLIPKDAVMIVRGDPWIYRKLDDGWYQRVPVTLGTPTNAKASIRTGMDQNWLIVTSGAALLRVAELDILAGESVGHGH